MTIAGYRAWSHALLALLSFGVIVVALPSLSGYWSSNQWLQLGIWIFLVSLLAIGLRRYYPQYAGSLLWIAVFGFIFLGVGVLPAASAMLFFLSAYCLGRLLWHWIFPHESSALLILSSLIAGVTLWLAIFGLMAHWPINFRVVYLAVQIVPLLAWWRLASQLQWRSAVAESAQYLCRGFNRLPYKSGAVTLGLLGYVAGFAFMPTVMWDDNVLHLAYWTQLTYHQRLLFDVESQIWLVAPFAVDLMHGVISVTAGADAKGAMNICFLIALASGIWALAARFVTSTKDKLLVLALFVSTPMLSSLLLGLQTDLFMAVLVTLGSYIALQKNSGWVSMLSSLLVAALCAATKLPAALLGVALLLMLACRDWRRVSLEPINGVQAVKLLGVVAVATFVALHAYVNAFVVTGNPVFPLYNGIFKSVYFPEYNAEDLRYAPRLGIAAYWDFFVNSHLYYETRNYTAGMQYALLAPMSLVIILFWRRYWSSLPLLLPLALYALPLFFLMHYWRYFFAILPLVGVTSAIFLSAHSAPTSAPPIAAGAQGWAGIATRISFVGLIILNLNFLPGASGVMREGSFANILPQIKRMFVERVAPEQIANKWINEIDPEARVLYDFSRTYGATLAGKPFYNNWYAPAFSAEVAQWASVDQVAAAIAKHRINYIFWDVKAAEEDQSPAREVLGEFLNTHGHQVFMLQQLRVYKVEPR